SHLFFFFVPCHVYVFHSIQRSFHHLLTSPCPCSFLLSLIVSLCITSIQLFLSIPLQLLFLFLICTAHFIQGGNTMRLTVGKKGGRVYKHVYKTHRFSRDK